MSSRTPSGRPASPGRRPLRRRLAAVLGLVALLSLLAACSKPEPKISVLSGSTYVTVSPSTYCFSATACRAATRVDLPVISAKPDANVLVDVPRSVKAQGWAVVALSLNGKTQLGSSGLIRDSHSYRIAAAQANGGRPFIVQVLQYRDGHPDNSVWSFLVQISGDTGA